MTLDSFGHGENISDGNESDVSEQVLAEIIKNIFLDKEQPKSLRELHAELNVAAEKHNVDKPKLEDEFMVFVGGLMNVMDAAILDKAGH